MLPVSDLSLDQSLLTDRTIDIKLVGVGGAGSNAVDRLKMDNLDRVQMAVINTDLQALSASPVQEKVLIGSSVTRGLGAGGDPDIGREAADTDRAKIAAVVKDQDLVFLVAGMGGGHRHRCGRRGGRDRRGTGRTRHRLRHDALHL